jgi:hypothetical protein
MPGFDRTGPRGMGPMAGGRRGLCNPRGTGAGAGFRSAGYRGAGFRGYAPPWPYAGRGRGGYARCQYPGFTGAYAEPYPVRDQDIDDLKSQAEAMRTQLARVEEAIKKMSRES